MKLDFKDKMSDDRNCMYSFTFKLLYEPTIKSFRALQLIAY